ncbi:MAG: lysine--tRNA ligase [Promethearchaeota archaeon]
MTTETYQHWIDALLEDVIEYWGDDIKTINCSCGLSVSGLQHVGRLRGEITTPNTLMHLLRDRGFETRHTIVRYTSDEWKGKPTQLAQFSDSKEARKYIGYRLIDVPDPKGELPSWVDRYWQDFGNYLDAFSRDYEIVSTHEIYKWPEMQDIVRYTVQHRDLVRKVVNQYRTRNPYPPNWIPVHVVCNRCHRISTTTVLSVDLDAYTADYQCDSCNKEGTTSLVNGKLSWRVEWAALWRVLNVGFEPFGKDHATPGGSRDSAKEISETVFQFKPPYPFPNEWVGLIEGGVDKGDMGSSDFHGFTPKEWESVAPGESLRYLYLKNKPMKRITLGLEYVPTYIGQYDRAERVYFKLEESKATAEELGDIRRSYELSQLQPLPSTPPIQIPFLHAVVLVQVVPKENMFEAVIAKLKYQNLIPSSITKQQYKQISHCLERARNWVNRYAPPSYRIRILNNPPSSLNKQITPQLRTLYQQLLDRLSPENWTENAIREAMKQVTKPLRRDKPVQQEFFRILYQSFFGQNEGPRISAFFAFIDPQIVIERLQYLSTPP